MARRPDPWMTLGWQLCRLGVESSAVIALRLERLVAGGPAAQVEAQRMVTEKLTALVEANAEAARLLARGDGGRVPGVVVAGYQQRVSANRRRLTAEAPRRAAARRQRPSQPGRSPAR